MIIMIVVMVHTTARRILVWAAVMVRVEPRYTAVRLRRRSGWSTHGSCGRSGRQWYTEGLGTDTNLLSAREKFIQ